MDKANIFDCGKNAAVGIVLLFFCMLHPKFASGQNVPLFYQSNYIRVVQPTNENNKMDTVINPFTGGMNNPTFFNVDLNNDGIKDILVFDREPNENQILLFTGKRKSSLDYRFAPQYESFFPRDLNTWVYIADYDHDGRLDIFTHHPLVNTGVKAYKNTSYIDPASHKFINQYQVAQDTLFYYDSLGAKTNIEVSHVASNAVFVDVDHDGYLDMLSFDESLNSIQYFRNQGKNKDSLKFYFTKVCWGYFEETRPHLYTPWNCDTFAQWDPKYKTNAHSVSSICALDADGDGDIDLLLGDGFNDSLAFLRNGYQKYKKDTIDNITFSYNDNIYPKDQAAVIPSMPIASLLDVNNDGAPDLVVSAGQPTDTVKYHKARTNNIWYYENKDTSSQANAPPVFILEHQDFLQNSMVDWGINSAPCFIDVDKDGRKDLIVAVRDGAVPRGSSHAILYLNKPGTNGGKPYLLYQTDDYLGLSSFSVPIQRPVPAAYLNGKDGKTDLIIGNDSGHVMYFKDKSTGTKPADFHLIQSSLQYMTSTGLQPIDVGNNSSPTSVDINKDGMTDLLVGANYGNISYYRCAGYKGPDNIPYFVLVTNTFGNINPMAGNDFQSAPCVADLDKDGKPDLLVGDRFGRLFYYHDFDTVTSLVPSSQSLVYDYGTNARSTGKLFSTNVIPAVANLDQDTLPDIMLGGTRGGLFFLGSVNNGFEVLHTSGIEPTMADIPLSMKLYPNPAKDYFSLSYSNAYGTRAATVFVYDMLGRALIKNTVSILPGNGVATVQTGILSNGVYIVNVVADGLVLSNEKLVIHR